MATDEPSRLGKLLFYSIMILILLIATVIIHVVRWGSSFPFFLNKTWLITLAAILLASVIVAPHVIEKAEFIPLIFGIVFAALSGLLIVLQVRPLIDDILEIISHPSMSPTNLITYVVLVALYSICIVFCVLILVRGINLIRDYSRKSA